MAYLLYQPLKFKVFHFKEEKPVQVEKRRKKYFRNSPTRNSLVKKPRKNNQKVDASHPIWRAKREKIKLGKAAGLGDDVTRDEDGIWDEPLGHGATLLKERGISMKRKPCNLAIMDLEKAYGRRPIPDCALESLSKVAMRITHRVTRWTTQWRYIKLESVPLSTGQGCAEIISRKAKHGIWNMEEELKNGQKPECETRKRKWLTKMTFTFS